MLISNVPPPPPPPPPHIHTPLAHVVPPLEYKAALELEMWKIAEEEAFQV